MQAGVGHLSSSLQHLSWRAGCNIWAAKHRQAGGQCSLQVRAPNPAPVPQKTNRQLTTTACLMLELINGKIRLNV